MPTYHVDKDGGDVRQMVDLILSRYHQHLIDAGVTLDVVIALPGDNDGSDLVKLHGRECYATISIVPYKMRVRGLADATLLVDGPKWNDMPERQRAALIDHELHHIELAMTKGKTVGETYVPPRVKRDDLDRPKLKLRPHDWEIGGFDLIVDRHRDHSIEIMQCREMLGGAKGPVRQVLLPFMADDPVERDVAAAASDPNAHGTDQGTSLRDEVVGEFRKRGILSGNRRQVITDAPGVRKTRAPRGRKAAAVG